MTTPERVLHLALLFAALELAAVRAQTATEVVLHNFGRSEGAHLSGVVRDPQGNLYGAAATSGLGYHGVLYKVNPAGYRTALYQFTGGTDGGGPGVVIRDAAGNLYGTTRAGGSAGFGVIYKLDTANRQTVLYNFTGGSDGKDPNGVIRDLAGNLYGTTYDGGTGTCALGGCGVLFRLDAGNQYTVLHTFTGTTGGNPTAVVIRDAAGNLYGTTEYGGAHEQGTVFNLDPAGNYTVLYNFTNRDDGGTPFAGVVRDAAGNLYGTTRTGGAANNGVIFMLDNTGHFNVIYAFTDGDSGSTPDAGLTLDSSGNLYGTRPYATTAHDGSVYKLDTARNYSVLHYFNGADGAEPECILAVDPAGNIYGTTVYGGATGGGVVFKLDPTGDETVLRSFPNGGLGTGPSGLTRDTAGDLYGSTYTGGVANFGVVYKMGPLGAFSVLHNFTGSDGAGPNAGVTVDALGNLYGTTTLGGAVTSSCTGSSYPDGCGVVYKLDPAGQETVLHSFSGPDGELPTGGVVLDPEGNLYGTASDGGTFGFGVLYKLSPAGNYTVLHAFTRGPDGATPYPGMILDSTGNLYGTTYGGGASDRGVIYKLDRAGKYRVLYSFVGGTAGGGPLVGVTLDSAGNLYGTTFSGGASGQGVIYELDPAGTYRVLYSFASARGTTQPNAVIRDPSGNLYGTTYFADTANGTVYKLDTAGTYTLLYSFTTISGGYFPVGALLRDQAGNLYGAASAGGTRGTGVIFKIIPQ